ncbi:MAG: long-chain fatty acid--CoA ligase [Reichenbachiella sp.]
MEVKRAFDFLYNQHTCHPIDDCLCGKVNGNWKKYSTQEFVDIANKLSLGFLELGLHPGDKVAIISPNRPEWNFVDQACLELGLVTVPMYPTITTEDYRYIFEHSEVKAVFAANEELIDRVSVAIEALSIPHIYSFDKIEGIDHWEKLLSLGQTNDDSVLEGYRNSVRPEDLMTIIYTSGTTGRPKGVMLSHWNVTSNALSLAPLIGKILPVGNARVLSFLPLCHIYERVAIYFYYHNSMSIYYAESMDSIGENIREVKPSMFTCVPRLIEKVYDKIISKGYELPLLKRKLFFWAVKLGLQYEPNEEYSRWYKLQLKIARNLVFAKWQKALGGKIQLITSGAAALQARLARVFWAAGMPVFEGYGLTETSPAITTNFPGKGNTRIGTVGQIIEGVEVKIADDGEILCQGPNVMLGYYKNPTLTAEVLKDGWFHTGDIGVIEDGFLRITDRKKEMFKTSGGKYIAPQLMENKFKESEFIEQIMVLGEGQKFPSALIVPNFESLKEWCENNELHEAAPEDLIKHPKVQGLYQIEVKKYNEEFGNWEQVKKFEIVEKVWAVASGELTPTMKLKRRVIKEKFKELIEKIYAMSS